MSTENKARLRALFEETDRRERADPELFAPDFIAHIAGNPPMSYDVFAEFLATFYAAFSDFSHAFEDIVAEGDRVAFRTVAQATHTADFMGVAPTGKRISVTQIGIARYVDGRLAELWNNPDQLGLMQQLGVVPAPPS